MLKIRPVCWATPILLYIPGVSFLFGSLHFIPWKLKMHYRGRREVEGVVGTHPGKFLLQGSLGCESNYVGLRKQLR